MPARPDDEDESRTTVVHCKREEYDVYIGRSSKRFVPLTTEWGNPFKVGEDSTREEVIEKFRAWIMEQDELLDDLHELRGKRLGCVRRYDGRCAPRACHGDVLELADELG